MGSVFCFVIKMCIYYDRGLSLPSGYTCYYSFMTAFFWLNVISFDLWHNFRGTRGINRSLEKKRFIMYSLYSWGIPIVFLVVTVYIQEYVDIPDEWKADLKPGIGGGQYCWINSK